MSLSLVCCMDYWTKDFDSIHLFILCEWNIYVIIHVLHVDSTH